MICRCSRCGVPLDFWQDQENNPKSLCSRCEWHLEPGDLVVCVGKYEHQEFLVKGYLYTVTAVVQKDCMVYLTVYGSDQLWPLSHWRLAHKPGDTDLKTGM